MTLWQPIESAPKDGTSILAYCPAANNMFIAAWRTWYSEGLRADVTAWWSNGAKNSYQPDQLIIDPTWWTELPEPPPFASALGERTIAETKE